MRKKKLNVNSVFFTLCLSTVFLCGPFNVVARDAEFDGGGSNPIRPTPTSVLDVLRKNQERTVSKWLDFFSSISNQEAPETYTIQPVTDILPSGSNNSNNFTPSQPGGVNGSFTAYRQCNYRNVLMSDGCSICNMGCGLTAVATTLSYFGNSSYDPPAILNKYKQSGYYVGCQGTNYADAKKTLNSLGLTTTTRDIFYSSSGLRIDEAANTIRGYVKNGWLVFALTNFCSGGCGHYIVIADIDANNNVTSYDPYYEPNSQSQPIGYSGRSPYPLYRVAFAVKK